MGFALRPPMMRLRRTPLAHVLGAAVFLGVTVPVLAATGLALPLPSRVCRMAVRVAEGTQTVARVALTFSVPSATGTPRLVVSCAIGPTSQEHAARFADPTAS